MLTKQKRTHALLLMLFVLAACTPLEPTLGPRPEPTPVSSPSLIPSPLPFPSPLPSATISPSATVAATPTATPTLQGPTWQLLDFPILPPPRIQSSWVLNSKDEIALLFGGLDSTSTTLNDLWSFDGSNWEQLQISNLPPSRALASMAFDEARQMTVLFGGSENNNVLGDTWLFNGVDWLQQHPLHSPAARGGASMAYDAARHQTILFGGDKYLGGSNYDTENNEMWVWNGTNWKQLFPARLPPGRYNTAMVYDPAHQNILLFGGASGDALLGDTWLWNGTTWVEEHPLHQPSARQAFGMAYDESRGQVILFGGQSADVNNIMATDTWAWDGQDWQQLQTIQAPPEGVAFGAQLVYLPDLQTVLLFNDFRQKVVTSDTSFTFTERSEVWSLIY